VALVAPAQNQPSPAAQGSAASGTKTVTVKGCLTGVEDRYLIGTSRDDLYLLRGDLALFKRYNAKMVEATGTLSPPANKTSHDDALSQQPPELQVTSLKKIGDRCGN
jgi:hypothetical protein